MDKEAYLTLSLRGRLKEWRYPAVMGIINVTPDSFFSGNRADSTESLLGLVAEMLSDGADIIDIGGHSTRPGAPEVSEEEETARVVGAVAKVRDYYPEAVISVDTFRASVAERCFDAGADIINDIGGGDLDGRMFETVSKLKCPYVLTHTRGTPDTMDDLTDYGDVCADVLRDLAFKADRLHDMGVSDVIIDPGFGFAKTTRQNYRLLGALEAFRTLGPVLAGISRKSMITRALGITPEEALNGTTVLNTIALLNGASILRVHDVGAAREAVTLFSAYDRGRDGGRRIITTRDEGRPAAAEIY